MTFHEVADRVFVLRYPVLNVNVSLILGDTAAALVDTLSTPAQASWLASEVAALTSLPLVVVNTHHHFDHCFGNAAFGDAEIWAHEATAARLRERGDALIREACREFGSVTGLEDLPTVTVTAPTRVVRTRQDLDLGGRMVTLHHLGRGHTAGDLVVHADGALIAGDLVEQGTAPSFDEAYPLEWPETTAALLDLAGDNPVVPGHGAVVDVEFVTAQHADLARLAWTIREGHADDATTEDTARRAAGDWPELGLVATRLAVSRGYAELDGKI